ncbi:MAG: DUF5018 domain-containing protein [Bacteroidales bacterium]|nr:DUF5018 domain-containing protein [Bacteroidales bacterium]
MKKTLYILIAAALLAACHQPEIVAPTADRQGITSLTAYFTSGKFVDQEIGRLEVNDPNLDRYVIPIPWYFPEESDDITTPYMMKLRVRATLQANCKLSPALSILDLTEENHFTYTDATGTSRDIIITGERVKSNKCDIITFMLKSPTLSGVVDKATKTVSLITANDLSVAEATAMVSAHATISPDPGEAHNYNDGFTFTVTAHDGVTKADYLVIKNVPEKINYGVNMESPEQLFNKDPNTGMGLPSYTASANVSMGVIGSDLIVNMGDGSKPRYYNKIIGTYSGDIKLGDAVPTGAIASDEQDHLLICNLAEPGETFTIWKTSAVNEAPTELVSFVNDQDLQLGLEMKVIGNIDTEASISITYPGMAGVTKSGRFHSIHIVDGAIVSSEVKDVSGNTFAFETMAGSSYLWGSGPSGSTCVPAASAQNDAGWYSCVYSDNGLTWFQPDLTIGKRLNGYGAGDDEVPGGGVYVDSNTSPNNLDTKTFNNGRFLALFVSNHFPAWWPGPQLYVYDITSGLQGNNVWDSPSLVFSVPYMYKMQYNTSTDVEYPACGDVILAPSADGYMLYVYYYDHNAQMLGGYSLDCIKR